MKSPKEYLDQIWFPSSKWFWSKTFFSIFPFSTN